MPTKTNKNDMLVKKLQRLERELMALRKQVRGEKQALPERSFRCIKVRTRGELCALPIAPIAKVVQVPECSPVPEAPDWVEGTFQYGDTLVLAVDVAARLMGAKAPVAVSQQVVILEGRPSVGLIIDEVGDIFDVSPDMISAPGKDITYASFLLGCYVEKHAGINQTIKLLAIESLANEFAALELES